MIRMRQFVLKAPEVSAFQFSRENWAEVKKILQKRGFKVTGNKSLGNLEVWEVNAFGGTSFRSELNIGDWASFDDYCGVWNHSTMAGWRLKNETDL